MLNICFLMSEQEKEAKQLILHSVNLLFDSVQASNKYKITIKNKTVLTFGSHISKLNLLISTHKMLNTEQHLKKLTEQ